MGLIGTPMNAEVVAAVGLALAWVMKGRFEQRLDSRFNTLQASIDTMRSDMRRIELAVGVQQDSA